MRIRSSAVAFVCALALVPASRARAGATVKSSKSNSSDREAAPSTTGTQAVRTGTVKSSKSNSSDRAVSGGVKDPTPADAVKLNSSKSNAYRSTSSSISGTVTNVDEKTRTVTLKRTDGSTVVMDASKLPGDLPKIGRPVKCVVINITGKTQLTAVSDSGAPPGK